MLRNTTKSPSAALEVLILMRFVNRLTLSGQISTDNGLGAVLLWKSRNNVNFFATLEYPVNKHVGIRGRRCPKLGVRKNIPILKVRARWY